MRRRSKKQLCILALVLFISSYISSSFIFAYFRDVYLPELLHYLTLILPDNISCYRDNTGVLLRNEIEPYSIFFYQTNCEGPTLREACVLEAASRIHPKNKTYLLYLGIEPRENIIKELLRLHNVKAIKINVESFVKDTPFADIMKFDVINRGLRKFKLVSDLLKIVTLYKYGGTVLDLDVIMAKSLDPLGPNWIIKDSDKFNLAALRFSTDILGRNAAGMILSKLKNQAHFGPMNTNKAFAEVFEDLCTTSNVKRMTNDTCHGYRIYDSVIFETIDHGNRYLYLKPGEFEDSSFGYHTWTLSSGIIPGNSLFAALARTYCPSVFPALMLDFVTDDQKFN